ncbi:hypothetical protein [Lelliottia wanjuensis]|uniref:hypothetical protein n=1 Tax=Lelliottia wanjuensis TaxID=3050585 RepID=UPI00254FCCF4|nr:hypothetical protein [Lelliottia sp. V104_15]MDK9607113.1 hypothetical protein [Lelliottia sp. V104_15]
MEKKSVIRKRHYFYLVLIMYGVFKLWPDTDNENPDNISTNSSDREYIKNKTPEMKQVTKEDALIKINKRVKAAVGEAAGSLVYREPSYYKNKSMKKWARLYGKTWHQMALDVGVLAYTKGVCLDVNSVTVDFYSEDKKDPVMDVDCGSSLYKNTYSGYIGDYGFISESDFNAKREAKIENSLPDKASFLSECDSEILSLANFPDTADTDWMTEVYNAEYKGKSVRAVDIRLNAKNAYGVPMHHDYQCFAGSDGRYRIVDK